MMSEHYASRKKSADSREMPGFLIGANFLILAAFTTSLPLTTLVHSGHLHEPGTHPGYGPRGSREAGAGAAGHLLRSLQGWRPQVREYKGQDQLVTCSGAYKDGGLRLESTKDRGSWSPAQEPTRMAASG